MAHDIAQFKEEALLLPEAEVVMLPEDVDMQGGS